MPRIDFCCFCIPWPKSWIKIPLLDLVNENVWIRWSVFLVILNMFFSSLLYTQFWILFPEEKTSKAMKECEAAATVGIQASEFFLLFMNTLALLLCTSLANWYRADTATNKILKSIIIIYVIIQLSFEIVNSIVMSTRCYSKNLFTKDVPRITHEFFLKAGKQPFRPIPYPFDLKLTVVMIRNAFRDAVSIRVYSSTVVLVSCRFLVRYISIIVVPLSLLMQLVSHFTNKWKFRKLFIVKSFTANRLDTYLKHVKRMFAIRTFAHRSTIKASDDMTGGDVALDEEGEEEFNRTDAVDDYWEESKDNVVKKYFKMGLLKMKTRVASLFKIIKRFFSRSSSSDPHYYPTRFIAGLIMSGFIAILAAIIFEFTMGPVMSVLLNSVYMVVVILSCQLNAPEEAYMKCQRSIVRDILPYIGPFTAITYVSVSVSLLCVLITLVLIARKYKSEVILQRKGTPSIDIQKCNPIYASFYPGYQAAHTTVSVLTGTMGLFAILFTCGLVGLFLGLYWHVFWKTLWASLKALSIDAKSQLIYYFVVVIGSRLAFQLFLDWFAKYLFFVHKSRFVRSVFSFSIIDAIMTVSGLFLGLFSAVCTSLIYQAAKTALLYVRLDSTSNPNFSILGAVMKLDISHNNPVVLVFSHLMNTFAKKETVSPWGALKPRPTQLKYKNYWFLLATLSKNSQLQHDRRSERSQYYVPKKSLLDRLRSINQN